MREPIRNIERLRHILEAIDVILERAHRMSFDELTADKVQFAGIVYYTQIIGEAAYKLTRNFVANHPETPWQDIIDMRHHIVHGYFTINGQRIWEVIQNDLQPLRQQIQQYIAELASSPDEEGELVFPRIPKDFKPSEETLKLSAGPLPEGVDVEKLLDEMWEDRCK